VEAYFNAIGMLHAIPNIMTMIAIKELIWACVTTYPSERKKVIITAKHLLKVDICTPPANDLSDENVFIIKKVARKIFKEYAIDNTIKYFE